MMRRRLLSAAAAVLALVAAAEPATGAQSPAKLAQVPPPAGCVAQTGLGVGCTVGRRLDLPSDVKVSPDGAFAYVTAFFSDAITVFSRDPRTGRLSQLPGTAGCIAQIGDGLTCADGTALNGAAQLTFSPDGAHVYVASRVSQAIAIFSRNPTTGALAQIGCLATLSTASSEGCTAASLPIGAVNSVSVSPDGSHVYAGAFDTASAVTALQRDESTGALRALSCVNAAGTGGCAAGRGLGFVFWVLASNDGENVYAAAWGPDTVAVFGRDAVNGGLSQLPGPDGCVAENGDGKTCADGYGLLGTHDIQISPDGSSVYVASNESDAITRYSRADGGALTRTGCNSTGSLGDCFSGRGIDGVQALAFGPGGDTLHSASVADSAAAGFERDATSGALEQPAGSDACVSETGSAGQCQDGVGLQSASRIEVTPDGRFAYVTGAGSDAVTTFTRGPQPEASLGVSPDPALMDQQVTFDGSASTDPGGSAIERYEWDLDGDGSFETDTGTTPTAARAFASAGSRTARLRVTDAQGDTGTTSRSFRVHAPPSASFTASPNPAQVRQTVTFDAGGSGDPEGPLTRYEWDLDGDGRFETDTGAAATTSRSYDTRGTRTVRLRVTDGDGATDETSRDVEITPEYRDVVLGTAGLEAYWRLGETSGSVAQDETANNRDGTYQGPTLGEPGALAGDPNAAAGFDSSDRISVADFGGSWGTLTVEAWIYNTATGGDRIIAGKENEYDLRLGASGGTLNLWLVAYGGTQVAIDDTLDYSLAANRDRWWHVAATFDNAADEVRLYRNGQLTKTITNFTATIGNGAGQLWLGRMPRFGGFGSFQGRLDEIAIYNAVLPPQTVTAHHQAGSGP